MMEDLNPCISRAWYEQPMNFLRLELCQNEGSNSKKKLIFPWVRYIIGLSLRCKHKVAGKLTQSRTSRGVQFVSFTKT
jgi:hypothetical protein